MRALPPRVALVRQTLRPPPKRADPFYLSAPWRRLMADLLYERGRRCERCGAGDCRIFGDHIVELMDGGAPFDPANVRLLCGACHGKKTQAAREARMRRTP